MSQASQQLSAAAGRQLTRTDIIKRELVGVQKQIQSLLTDKDKANRFLAAALVVAGNDNLKNCSEHSIAQALVGVAMADLQVDPNIGHTYLVPYGNKAQLQIGAKGFKQLMFRAGWICKELAVYNCDTFEMSFNGWDNQINFIPAIDERDEGNKQWVIDNLRGIYVVARHADTHDEYSMFVNKTVIEKLRKNSPTQKSDKPTGNWLDWYEEMACAKAIKKLAKKLPIGDRRVQTIIAVDDKVETGSNVDVAKSIEAEYVVESQEPETNKHEQVNTETGEIQEGELVSSDNEQLLTDVYAEMDSAATQAPRQTRERAPRGAID